MKKILVLGIIAVATVAIGYVFAGTNEPKPVLSFKGEPKNPEQLGEMLFFEKKLSLTKEVSCASCHIPEYGFADTIPFSKGVDGRLGKRNTSSCANMTDRPYFFYDGRAASLEDQVKFPVEDLNEMGMPIADVVSRLNKDKNYIQYFKAIYKQTPTEANLKSAIAAFERTLETSNTPFDRYMKGDDNAISASAQRGRELFMDKKTKCFDCHFSPDFTGDEFRNIGLYDGVTYKDEGRYAITNDIRDLGKFKVPSMRNVAATAPYMHNGMFKTLREVIDYYDDPYKTVARPINMDSLLRQPLHLTEQEKTDLENFLITLTDDRFAKK
jgi:cytochrome c peroxidase